MAKQLVDYYLNLKEQYYDATGKNQASLDYVLKWHNERQYMISEYSRSLYDIKNSNDIWREFLNNSVEVGIIGKENSLSPFLSNLYTFSPIGYAIEKENAYTVRLEDLIKSTDSDSMKLLNSFDTFLSHNPNFNKEQNTLEALKELAWRNPTVAISVFGSIYDNNRNNKLKELKNYKEQIILFHEKEKIDSPIVKEFYKETNYGTYISTIITDQYIKSLLKEEIAQVKLNNLTNSVSSERRLTLERGK